MELFVVNRYLGENGELRGGTKNDGSLEKLLNKIEERKKLRLQGKDQTIYSNNTSVAIDVTKTSDDENDKKQNKRKRKRELNRSELDESKANGKITKVKRLKKLESIPIHISAKESFTDETEINSRLQDNSTVLLEQEKSTYVKKKKKLKKDKIEKHSNELISLQTFETEQSGNKGNEANSTSNKTPLKYVDSNDISDNLNEEGNKLIVGDDKQDDISEFTVIGGHDFKHKSTVTWVLPEWLLNPILITGSFKDKSAAVKHFNGLDDTISHSLKKNKIKYFFPVQQTVIPWLLKENSSFGPGLKFWPRDICVCTPTGSGKTLSYVIPIIQHLKQRFIRRIGALIVVPVQDLASQVARVFNQYVAGTGLKVLYVTGKATPLQQEQKNLVCYKTGHGYSSLVDIMVTTPGRLVEHIKKTPGFNLHHLRFLVIDEADRVIDVIKNDWLYHLENHMSSRGIGTIPTLSLNSLNENPPRPQKLLFSATLTQDPEKLKQINLFQPRMFVAKSSNSNENLLKTGKFPNEQDTQMLTDVIKPNELEEQWIKCDTQLKPIMLYHLLVTKSWRGVLCFTHFTDAAHQLTLLLRHLAKANELSLRVEEISSKREFLDRSKIADEFRAGNVDVLVCSDLYARGIDISEVRYVVLYSPPVHSRNYIHQVGRTARAGMAGTALTFVTESQVGQFQKMVNNMGQSNMTEVVVPENELSYLEAIYKEALSSLKEETFNEKQSADKQTKITRRDNFKHIRRMRKDAVRKRKVNVTVKERKPKIRHKKSKG